MAAAGFSLSNWLPSFLGGAEDIGPQHLSYEPGHTEWEAGLASEEIYRTDLHSWETLNLQRVELQKKGGGTGKGLTLEVYDDSAGVVIDSVDAGQTSVSGGEVPHGSTVLIRITNKSGKSQTAMPIVRAIVEEE
ncbi:hypothetical protein ACFQO4_20565 [Saliphagus sp. GCM10025334]